MQSNYKRIIIKYVVTLTIQALMAILTLYNRDFLSATELIDKYLDLSYAFTIPGVVFIMLGILVWLSNEGSLSALGYMLKRLGNMLNPFSKVKDEKYADYVADREKVTGYGFLIVCGFIYLIVAIIFTILFYTVY